MTVWNARIYNTLKNAHVFGNVVNRDYEGDISSQGDSVKINSIGAVSVNDYTKYSSIDDPEQLDSAQTILVIDQAKYFNFQVDDVDKAQANVALMDAAMEEAGFALAAQADDLIAGFHDKAHAEVEDLTLKTNPENVYDILAEAAEALDQENVPREGRWAVVPPFVNKAIVLSGLMETAGSIDANEINANGYVTRLLGFDIWMSNNLKVDDTNTMGLAGTRKAISFAEQILSTEAYRPEGHFSDAVKGLHVYGAKVVYPKALVRLKVKDA